MALHGTWTGCLITENNVQASRSEAELSRFDSSWTWQIPSTCIRHASKINASFCAKFSPNGSFEMGCCCCFRSRWLLNTIYIGFSYKYTMCRELELPFRMQFEQRKINIFFFAQLEIRYSRAVWKVLLPLHQNIYGSNSRTNQFMDLEDRVIVLNVARWPANTPVHTSELSSLWPQTQVFTATLLAKQIWPNQIRCHYYIVKVKPQHDLHTLSGLWLMAAFQSYYG